MKGQVMLENETIEKRVREIAERKWDLSAIKDRFRMLSENGIPKKLLDPHERVKRKQEILSRVQRRGEEYEFLSHSCAKGSALALMEEFGLGNMEILKALSPFPGLGMTGWICGGVTGSLMALGLYFGSDDLLDYEGTGRTMAAAREFIPRFEKELGAILCPKIQERAIFGRYMDPRGSKENFEAFQEARGYEKCALPAGIGAKIAAEIILERMEDDLKA
jgi:C_GCAxxG_C_C family probable redox protein